MNIKLHTPKSLTAGSGMSSLKQFFLALVATNFYIHSHKLSICIFTSILLSLSIFSPAMAQNRLTPRASIYDMKSPYYQFVIKNMIIGDEEKRGALFYYIVCPSFSAEYVLSADFDNTLQIAKANHNLWGSMFTPQQDSKDTIFISQIQVPDSVMIALDRLMNSSIESSSYLFKKIGLDGTSYWFGNTLMAASCWGPFGGKCHDLVFFWEQCCAAVEEKSIDSLQVLMPLCRSLTISFRKDYPSDFFEPEKCTFTSGKGTPKHRIILNSHFVEIEWSGDDSQEKEKLCAEFESVQGVELVNFSKYLFCEHLIDKRVTLKPDNKNHIDFDALRQEFDSDPNQFFENHPYKPHF